VARIAYLGTPALAVPPLQALVDAGHDVALVVSRPDRRRGRGGAVAPSPVKAAAIELGLPVTESVADVVTAGVELGVVVAYGRIIPVDVLERVPMVNLHFSLLPRWRGAAPVERAILAGDPTTGVCAMTVEEGLDTGAVFACEEVVIEPTEHLEDLRARLVERGSALMVRLVEGGVAGLPPAQPQQGDATYAEKIRPEELELRWDLTADQLARVVRLDHAWTIFRGRRLHVLEAVVDDARAGDGVGDLAPGAMAGSYVATGDGVLRLVTVQPEGKTAMRAEDWLRGARPTTADILG
jgi:methionyl-tRNA formyltransferase